VPLSIKFTLESNCFGVIGVMMFWNNLYRYLDFFPGQHADFSQDLELGSRVAPIHLNVTV